MAMFTLLVAVLAGAAAVASAANPDKPVVSPSIQTLFSHMASDMWDNMPGVPSRWRAWNNGSTVQACQYYINKYSLTPSLITTYSITYDDPSLYLIWRTHFRKFRPRPAARGYVNTLVAIPKQSDGYAGWSNTNGDIAIMDPIDLRILSHEVSHHLDYDIYKSQLGGLLSDNALWQNEYAKDTNSVSVYAQSSWHENIAEVGSVAWYDKFVPGGFQKIHNKVSAFQHQLSAFEKFFATQMTPGGNCTYRKPLSPIVNLSSATNSRSRFAAAKESS